MSFHGKNRTGSAFGVVPLMDFGGHRLQKGQAQRTAAKSCWVELPSQYSSQLMERLFLPIPIKLRLRAFP